MLPIWISEHESKQRNDWKINRNKCSDENKVLEVRETMKNVKHKDNKSRKVNIKFLTLPMLSAQLLRIQNSFLHFYKITR